MRVGFNAGDRANWPADLPYQPFTGAVADWDAALGEHLRAFGATDIVLYGDSRPRHAAARRLAAATGLRLHCFEEGYLRPYWVTYERGGSNGRSRLMDMSVASIRARMAGRVRAMVPAPAQWGSVWRHSWHGCMYHARILFANRAYPGYRTHRAESVAREWWLHVNRLVAMPWHLLQRNLATRALLRSGQAYHLALLQLAHDTSVLDHSEFATMEQFMRRCAEAFAKAGPGQEKLIFKAHPLEDEREPLRRIARGLAREFGLQGRIGFLYGGRLGPVLDAAKSVVTVNSTAGQQALWRGLPTKILGQAVYGKPEFVSMQPLEQFFAAPAAGDVVAYREYRSYLLATSQVGGGYYDAAARAGLLRRVIPMMLAERDPYDEFDRPIAEPGAYPRLVAGGTATDRT